MQTIQWFPGHMTKAIRMMEDEVKLVDGVICVLDARASFACINRKLIKLFGSKPVVFVLNKSDTITKEDKNRLIKAFSSKGYKVVATNGTDKKDCNLIVESVLDSLKEKIARNKEKGVSKTVRVMVSGIPNTGKSTIINTISGGKRAMTGNKAGVTRSKQWIRLSGFEMLDTPGTMPPSFDNQTYAKHLAYIGSINDDILDFEELCIELLQDLKVLSPQKLIEVYKIKDLDVSGIELFTQICKNRGYIIRGGEYDYERGSKAIIDDFRKGKLGKICLETEEIKEEEVNG